MTKTKKTIASIVMAIALVCLAGFTLIACGGGNALVSIEVNTENVKVDYVEGEKLDLTGLVVTATYGEGDKAISKEITDYTTTPAAGTELKASNSAVTVTYAEGDITVTKRFSIKVHNNIVGVEKTADPEKVKYFDGQEFDVTGMKVKVTYENGKIEDVDLATLAATEYEINPAKMGTDTTKYTVTYKGHSFDVAVEAVNGVYIEAEDGILPLGSVLCTDGLDNEPQYKPSGTGYVGDLNANDKVMPTMTFVFNSDKAGKGDVSFRMASQYLKQDSNWTPIWMGDVQLNKIANLYVNDVKVDIDDNKILLGGGEKDGEGNGKLWLNWQTVEFKDVAFVAGKNTIALEFKEHDYDDCSQSGKNNKFTANIDSIIVTSDECTITKYVLALEAENVKATGAHLEVVEEEDEDGNTVQVPYYVIDGTVYYTGYDEDEVAYVMNNLMIKTVKSSNASQYTFSGIGFDFQGNLALSSNGGNKYLSGASYRKIVVTAAPSDKEGAGATDYKGTFKIMIDVSSLGLTDGVGKYSTHFDPNGTTSVNFDFITEEEIEAAKTADENTDPKTIFDTTTVSTQSIKVGYNTYTLVYEPWYSNNKGIEYYYKEEHKEDIGSRKDHYYGTVGLIIETKVEVKDVVANAVALEEGTEDNANKLYLRVSGTANVVEYTESDAAKVLAGMIKIGDVNISDLVSATVVKKADGENDTYSATFDITVDVTTLAIGDYSLKLADKEIVDITDLVTTEKEFGRNKYQLVETDKTIPAEEEGGEDTVVKVVSLKKASNYTVNVTKTDIFTDSSNSVWTIAEVDGKIIVSIEGNLEYTKSAAFTDSEEDKAYLTEILVPAIAARFNNVRVENNGNASSVSGWAAFKGVTSSFEVVSETRFKLNIDVTVLGTQKVGVTGMIKMACDDQPESNGDYKPKANTKEVVELEVDGIGYRVSVDGNSWNLLTVKTYDATKKTTTIDLDGATLKVEGGKVYMVIHGTSKNYEGADELKEAVVPTSAIDAQDANGSAVIDLIEKVAFTFNAEDGTYEITVEITELTATTWWMHFGPKTDGKKDVRNKNGTDPVTCDGKTYQFVVEPQNGWTAYRLKVENVTTGGEEEGGETPETPAE